VSAHLHWHHFLSACGTDTHNHAETSLNTISRLANIITSFNTAHNMIHTGSNYSMVLGHCHRFSIIVMSALYLKKHFTYVKQVPCAHFTTASASILAQLRRFINHLLTYLLTYLPVLTSAVTEAHSSTINLARSLTTSMDTKAVILSGDQAIWSGLAYWRIMSSCRIYDNQSAKVKLW